MGEWPPANDYEWDVDRSMAGLVLRAEIRPKFRAGEAFGPPHRGVV